MSKFSTFQDRRIRDRIFEELWKGVEAAQALTDDAEDGGQGYCLYIGFQAFGLMLRKDLGDEKFQKLVDEIMDSDFPKEIK